MNVTSEEFGGISLTYGSPDEFLIFAVDGDAGVSEDEWDRAIQRLYELGYFGPGIDPDVVQDSMRLFVCIPRSAL